MTQRALANGDTISLWVKVSAAALESGAINFAIGPIHRRLQASATETVAISAADTNWHKYTMTLTGADDTTADNFGFYVVAADPVAGIIYVDDICIDHPALNILAIL